MKRESESEESFAFSTPGGFIEQVQIPDPSASEETLEGKARERMVQDLADHFKRMIESPALSLEPDAKAELQQRVEDQLRNPGPELLEIARKLAKYAELNRPLG